MACSSASRRASPAWAPSASRWRMRRLRCTAQNAASDSSATSRLPISASRWLCCVACATASLAAARRRRSCCSTALSMPRKRSISSLLPERCSRSMVMARPSLRRDWMFCAATCSRAAMVESRGVEPVPAGVFAPTQLFEQCASPPFQLFEAAFVGFEVARVGGQHEAARAGLDVLQRRQHGLDRGDDFQAVADRTIGFKQRFLGALALPAEGDEQDRREQKRQPMPSFRGACRQTRTPLAGIYTSL